MFGRAFHDCEGNNSRRVKLERGIPDQDANSTRPTRRSPSSWHQIVGENPGFERTKTTVEYLDTNVFP